MNRAQRRAKSNAPGVNLDAPASLMEVLKISRAAAEDVVSEYANRTNHLQVALTLQLEILKELVLDKGLISKEEFDAAYNDKVQSFMRRQEELLSREMSEEVEAEDISGVPNMGVSVSDIEVKTEVKDD